MASDDDRDRETRRIQGRGRAHSKTTRDSHHHSLLRCHSCPDAKGASVTACGTVNASQEDGNIFVALEEDEEVEQAFKEKFSCTRDEMSSALSIDASPGNCVELDAFMEDYPLEGHGLAWIHSVADARRQRAKDFHGFLNHEIPRAHFNLLLPARDYQEMAASIL